MHPALVKAMRSALDRLSHPRHIGALIGLLLVNSKTVPGVHGRNAAENSMQPMLVSRRLLHGQTVRAPLAGCAS